MREMGLHITMHHWAGASVTNYDAWETDLYAQLWQLATGKEHIPGLEVRRQDPTSRTSINCLAMLEEMPTAFW
eukprot:1139079-Pelagomonas_calceolata.AAC.3